MKKLLVSAGVAGLLLGGAGSAFAVSGNANQQACFGQGRAAYASTHTDTGQIISQRAQDGTNAQMNADYRDACQSAG